MFVKSIITNKTLPFKKLAAALMLALALLVSGIQTQAAAQNQPSGTGNETRTTTTSKVHKPNPNTQYGKLQQKLKDLGLYKGEITGYKNPETTDALNVYQKQNNLKVTGTLSKETKEKLGITASKAKAESPVNKSTK